MTAYKHDLEQARRALRPPENAYERLLRRRDRKRRNSRIAAGVLGLAIAASGLFAVVSVFTNGREQARPGPKCVPSSADLTHSWPGDGTGADLVGGLPVTLHGDATFGPGLVGQAFVLDGAGDFVSVPDNPAINLGTGDFTVALWVNFDDTEGEQILVEKWVQRSFEPEIVRGWTFEKLSDNRLGFSVGYPRKGSFAVVSKPQDIPVGTWIHFAARRRGSDFQILMNGNVIATNAVPDDAVLQLDSHSSLKFGHRGDPDDTPGSISHQRFFLNGRIDDVKLVVGRTLSHSEIREIVEAGTRGVRC